MAGHRMGKGTLGQFLVNATFSGKGADAQVIVYGVERKTFTAAQIQTANGTPLELVAAPGTGFVLIVSRVVISKAAGTAFTGVAGGEDFTVVYSGGSDTLVTNIETTGFLDQTTAEIRVGHGPIDPTGTHDLTALLDTAVDLELLSGNITAGDEVIVDTYYERFPSFLVNV